MKDPALQRWNIPCGKQARWEIRGTTPGGDVDDRDYHWISYACGPHLAAYQAAVPARPWITDIVVTAISVPTDRWAVLLMLRAWVDGPVPDSVAARLADAEDHAARCGLTGERYAWAVFEHWWDHTPAHEERYLIAAWRAVGEVVAGEHGAAWTLPHLRNGRACP
ncbi:hypothetical protein [Actinoallomurus acanthiterrae]